MAHTRLKEAYEAVHGKLPKEEIPSRYMIGEKLNQLSANEPKYEDFAELTTREDGDSDIFTPVYDESGRIHMKKGGPLKKRSPASNGEELRNRHRILCNALLFSQTRHANRSWLIGLGPRDWERFTDYFLGPKVLQLTIKNGDGGTFGPTFSQVLDYEAECRKKMYEMINEQNMTMKEALVQSTLDGETRTFHFTTPVMGGAMKGKKRYAPDEGDQPNFRPNGGTNATRGAKTPKGKGNGDKGDKSKKDSKGRHRKAPDGRAFCYKFNNEEACDGTCGFVRACKYCLKENCASKCAQSKKKRR
jgi:hypothetical protein